MDALNIRNTLKKHQTANSEPQCRGKKKTGESNLSTTNGGSKAECLVKGALQGLGAFGKSRMFMPREHTQEGTTP